MKAALLAFLCLLPSFALAEGVHSPAAHCTAIYRSLDAQNRSVEISAPLLVKTLRIGLVKQRARLGGRTFLLTEGPLEGDFFAQILASPESLSGTAVRGTADSLGRFSASEVKGASVYRLECRRASH